MVSEHGCIRILREAMALQGLGHQVEVACPEPMWGRERLDAFHLFLGAEQLRRTVLASRAEVVHVFNEPDTLVPIVKASAGNRPVIFDVQDLNSLRWERFPDKDEVAAFEAADGIVHISPACRRVAEAHHGPKPGAMLACYVNESFYADPKELPEPCWNSMVYEGGLSVGSHRADGLGDFRALEPVVAAFAEQGFAVHLFPAGQPPAPGAYENLGAVVHGGLAYPSLLRAIRPYGVGFVGSPFATPLMSAALPNKLYEYISQGVVPVCWNATTAGNFVEGTGIGIALEGLQDLREQIMPRVKACRKRLLERRREWTMEKHIGALDELYQVVQQKVAA